MAISPPVLRAASTAILAIIVFSLGAASWSRASRYSDWFHDTSVDPGPSSRAISLSGLISNLVVTNLAVPLQALFSAPLSRFPGSSAWMALFPVAASLRGAGGLGDHAGVEASWLGSVCATVCVAACAVAGARGARRVWLLEAGSAPSPSPAGAGAGWRTLTFLAACVGAFVQFFAASMLVRGLSCPEAGTGAVDEATACDLVGVMAAAAILMNLGTLGAFFASPVASGHRASFAGGSAAFASLLALQSIGIAPLVEDGHKLRNQGVAASAGAWISTVAILVNSWLTARDMSRSSVISTLPLLEGDEEQGQQAAQNLPMEELAETRDPDDNNDINNNISDTDPITFEGLDLRPEDARPLWRRALLCFALALLGTVFWVVCVVRTERVLADPFHGASTTAVSSAVLGLNAATLLSGVIAPLLCAAASATRHQGFTAAAFATVVTAAPHGAHIDGAPLRHAGVYGAVSASAVFTLLIGVCAIALAAGWTGIARACRGRVRFSEAVPREPVLVYADSEEEDYEEEEDDDDDDDDEDIHRDNDVNGNNGDNAGNGDNTAVNASNTDTGATVQPQHGHHRRRRRRRRRPDRGTRSRPPAPAWMWRVAVFAEWLLFAVTVLTTVFVVADHRTSCTFASSDRGKTTVEVPLVLRAVFSFLPCVLVAFVARPHERRAASASIARGTAVAVIAMFTARAGWASIDNGCWQYFAAHMLALAMIAAPVVPQWWDENTAA